MYERASGRSRPAHRRRTFPSGPPRTRLNLVPGRQVATERSAESVRPTAESAPPVEPGSRGPAVDKALSSAPGRLGRARCRRSSPRLSRLPRQRSRRHRRRGSSRCRARGTRRCCRPWCSRCPTLRICWLRGWATQTSSIRAAGAVRSPRNANVRRSDFSRSVMRSSKSTTCTWSRPNRSSSAASWSMYSPRLT